MPAKPLMLCSEGLADRAGLLPDPIRLRIARTCFFVFAALAALILFHRVVLLATSLQDWSAALHAFFAGIGA